MKRKPAQKSQKKDSFDKEKWLKQKRGQQKLKKDQAVRASEKPTGKPQKKADRPSGNFLFGTHAVEAAVRLQRRKVHEIWTSHPLTTAQSKLFSNVRVNQVERAVLEDMFPDAVHQGLAAKVSPLQERHVQDVWESPLLLALDQVTDPHNLGAILRSADAFGCGGVLVPTARTAPLTDVVAKTAAGAMETIPVIPCNLAQTLQQLKEQGYWMVGLDGHSKTTLADVPNHEKICLVMGSEGEGIRPLVAKQCDYMCKLPMVGTVESLNVSVATGISLYALSTKS